MLLTIATYPFHSSIVTILLSKQELHSLIGGKEIESKFTNPKVFIRLEDAKKDIRGLKISQVIVDEYPSKL